MWTSWGPCLLVCFYFHDRTSSSCFPLAPLFLRYSMLYSCCKEPHGMFFRLKFLNCKIPEETQLGVIDWLVISAKEDRPLSSSLSQQFCLSSILWIRASFLVPPSHKPSPSAAPCLPREMVSLSLWGFASQTDWSCRDKGNEANVIKAFSKLLVNGFTCSSWGTNGNSNWPRWPPLIIQGAVISRGLIHLFAGVLADCRIITGNSS